MRRILYRNPYKTNRDGRAGRLAHGARAYFKNEFRVWCKTRDTTVQVLYPYGHIRVYELL